MECRPKEHGNRVDGTEFNMAMANSSVLISATSLVVFGVVQQDAEYL
jgi:hypothetical protein